jgi:hypothetical protein
MAQQTQSKRTLPKRERAFWRKVQKLVLPQLAGKSVVSELVDEQSSPRRVQGVYVGQIFVGDAV